ncbi:hypothetical protein R9X47_21820 [Wukongibacter baidiensis]|uniref:hypothetical protein n=1 Tax=Wukongibacter baidiensis TaxID=1723361 RepID=UPI003D7FCB48
MNKEVLSDKQGITYPYYYMDCYGSKEIPILFIVMGFLYFIYLDFKDLNLIL